MRLFVPILGAAALLIAFAALGANYARSGSEPPTKTVNDSSDAGAPTPTPPLDRRITAGMIHGNPRKYVGAHVLLKCKLLNVIDSTHANALCGDDVSAAAASRMDTSSEAAMQRSIARQQDAIEKAIDSQGLIVLQGGDVGNLDGSEHIMVDGTVSEPFDGKNGLGVEMTFAVIDVDHLTHN